MTNPICDIQTQTENNTAWVFPGQGSQKVGMGLDLIKIPLAKKRFELAEKLLGWSVPESCQSQAKLSRTLYVQPCLYVVLSILIDLMRGQGYKPNLVAGYSLGEYMALYAAKVFDFETGLYIMKHRGELMESTTKGVMASLIGFNKEQLEQQIEQTANVWRINDDLNYAVISGSVEAVESVLTQIKAERIIRLKPHRAFHTPLIAATAAEFQQFLESIPFESAKVPVLSTIEPDPIVEVAQLKDNLIKQIIEPVGWRKISIRLVAEEIETVVEISPSTGLTKQMKRTYPKLINVSTAAEISIPKVAA